MQALFAVSFLGCRVVVGPILAYYVLMSPGSHIIVKVLFRLFNQIMASRYCRWTWILLGGIFYVEADEEVFSKSY